MNIRFISLLFILISASLTVIGQTYNHPPNQLEYDSDKWHFGFTLGLDFQNARIANNSNSILSDSKYTVPNGVPDVNNVYIYSDIPSINPGFHVGIITSLRLGEYFNLRMIPSLSLGQKDIESIYFFENSDLDVSPDTLNLVPNLKTTVKSTYFSLPILIKYKAVRIENARPYVIAGVNLKYDLATDIEEPITLKKLDGALEFGLGSDFYMQTFRLGIEVRFGLGLRNVLQTNRPEGDKDPYITASMDRIRAKTFTIAINFE